jgi:signal peptidase I
MRSLIVAFVVAASTIAYAQAPSLQRGSLVRVLPGTSPSETATTLVLRVVAVPNDRLSASDSGLYVNDMPVNGFSPDFLARVAASPEQLPQTVPDGHYFVMGEQRSTGNVSEYWGLHSGERLQLAQ